MIENANLDPTRKLPFNDSYHHSSTGAAVKHVTTGKAQCATKHLTASSRQYRIFFCSGYRNNGFGLCSGFGVGCIYDPHIVRRVGHARTFIAMATIVSSAVLVHAFVFDFIVWWLLSVATGICLALLYITLRPNGVERQPLSQPKSAQMSSQ